MKFEELGLAETLLRAVRAEGYQSPTKIQAAAIPSILQGRDVLGCAQTGTGKTAAFALPTLQRLSRAAVSGGKRRIRHLVLAPTRELATQIGESYLAYGRHTGLRRAVIHGGVSQSPQVRALTAGVDTLIATPGRLLDLMQQGFADLSCVEVLVLDEADRMLDMGFIHDLRRIVAQVPRRRQTLLFSATMPQTIRQLASQWLHQPVDVQIGPPSRTVEKIRQSVIHVEQAQKPALLAHWLRQNAWTRTLVFTRTKHGADKVAKGLAKAGIPAGAFHGNKSQSARQRALDHFKTSELAVLVATDIAARGLDIDEISHVVNYDLPVDVESYVHRIGRTGRAGAEGVALSLCSSAERAILTAIEKLTRQTLPVDERPEGLPDASSTPAKRNRSQSSSSRKSQGKRRGVAAGKVPPSDRTKGRHRKESRRQTERSAPASQPADAARPKRNSPPSLFAGTSRSTVALLI